MKFQLNFAWHGFTQIRKNSTFYEEFNFILKFHLIQSFGFQSESDFDIEENVIQREYLYGLQQIQQHLNFSLLQLTQTEHDFALNTTNLIIHYGENLSHLTDELFRRYGFIADIKNLVLFVKNVRARLKENITRSIKQFSTQKISRMNSKLYQKFLANLYSMLNNHIDRIAKAVDSRYDLMECWDSYKAIYLQIGLEATSEISVSVIGEIKRLRSDFRVLSRRITIEINRTLKLLDRQHESPFVERLRASYFVS